MMVERLRLSSSLFAVADAALDTSGGVLGLLLVADGKVPMSGIIAIAAASRRRRQGLLWGPTRSFLSRGDPACRL